MKIKKLLTKLPVTLFKGSKELEIRGICGHSRQVSPGDLFLSRRSKSGDEENYIDQACQSGAVAILTDFPNPARTGVAQLVCENVRALEPKLASFFYDEPSKKMACVGITGTNGKTTTSFILHHLLSGIDLSPGLIGTIEYRFGNNSFPAELTTPEASILQKKFKEMVDFGCKAVVMEASSIGIDQGRTQQVDFDIALFTNFTQDHLDYHKTMEAYANAKQRLFNHLKPEGTAVVNSDDPMAEFMIQHFQGKVIRFGIESSCDLKAENIEEGPERTLCQVHF
jgi:UDP-N-acetylmuramoyl-L-alanyl-D-glutamate--2,6-diaminopimelate ligase